MSRLLSSVCFAFLCLFFPSVSATAQELCYSWQPGKKFSYEVTVTVDSPTAVITYKGMTHYTVDSVAGDQIRVVYRGGLSESNKLNIASSPGSPFGRGSFNPGPPMGFRSMFEKPEFAGKVQTTNTISMTNYGSILSMEGDSQLPFLLGNVSLLPFEPLPNEPRKDWAVNSGITIAEKSDNDDRFFVPRGPFAHQQGKSVQHAGIDEANYAIQSNDLEKIVIRKTSRLTMPEIAGKPSYEMTGEGTWTFDKSAHIPKESSYNLKLKLKDKNLEVTIPISIKFNHVPAEVIAKMEAEAQQKTKEKADAVAAAKEMAEKPLTSDEKQAFLDALNSKDESLSQAALSALSLKTPKEPDPELALAIRPYLNHASKTVSAPAHKALLNWSPEYKKQHALAEAYKGPASLSATNIPVTDSTSLYVGQVVQINSSYRWEAAQIQEVLEDGTVKVASLSWGKPYRSQVVKRTQMQLPPPEFVQPVTPPTGMSNTNAAAKGAVRMWSDLSGRFKIEAEFVSLIDGSVSLRRKDGRLIAIALEKLSADDQTIAKGAALDAENPFKEQ